MKLIEASGMVSRPKVRTRPNTNNLRKRILRPSEPKADEDSDILVTDNEALMNMAGRKT